MNSTIISLIKKTGQKLNFYYIHSTTAKVLKAIAASFIKQSEKSVLLTSWRKDWGIENVWENSLFFLPIKAVGNFFQWLIKRQAITGPQIVKKSKLVQGFRRNKNEIECLNTRHIGVFLLAFTASEGVLWLLSQGFHLTGGLLRLMLLLLSIGLIVLNRSWISLMRGSQLLKWAGHFLKIRGMDDAAGVK